MHSTTTTSQVQHHAMIPYPADYFHPRHQRRTHHQHSFKFPSYPPGHQSNGPAPAQCHHIHVRLYGLPNAIHLGIVVLLQSILATRIINVSTLDTAHSIHTNLLLIRPQSRRLRVHVRLCRLHSAIHLGIVVLQSIHGDWGHHREYSGHNSQHSY